MRGWAILATGVTLLSLTTVPPLVSGVMARDRGVMGQTWPITEPDLLQTIDSTLQTLEAVDDLRVNRGRSGTLAPTGPHHAEPGVHFINLAVGINPRVRFADACAVKQPRVAQVAGLCVDLGHAAHLIVTQRGPRLKP